MSDRISKDLRKKVMEWTNTIEKNMGLIAAIRGPVLHDLVSEMNDFVKEDNFTVIFYNDAMIEPCPKCDYERGRVYQWLGRWYFMCINCAHGIPEPVLVDWGKYGELNKEGE
jgi:hypothetical protein